MTISRSRIYYGSLGISQPIIHLCQQWHIHSYRHTLIPTYTYINIHLYQPFTFTFSLSTQATQQYKQTHQHHCSKTVITFHIIHYQILRHQECVHSPECNQYWEPFHDSTSKKCAPIPGVCHAGPMHTQAIGHHGNRSKHVLHMEFNN